MGAQMNLHGGSRAEYDAVNRPEITARDGSCKWKWLQFGDVLLTFHEPVTDTEPKVMCLTCGKPGDQHYSFPDADHSISVCEPGQYARRWRKDPK